MTLNRMGNTRGKNNRKLWLTGTLTLGAVAASGGVAMAALHEEPGHSSKVANVSQSFSSKSEGENEGVKKAKAAVDKAKGQVCIRLDKEAQKAIAEAEAASKGGTVTVPLSKVEVLPCTKSSGPKPAPTVTGAPVIPNPTNATSAPVKTTPPKTTPPKTTPPKTTPPKPAPPKPTVTSTAS
jgi:hypothetical protein